MTQSSYTVTLNYTELKSRIAVQREGHEWLSPECCSKSNHDVIDVPDYLLMDLCSLLEQKQELPLSVKT